MFADSLGSEAEARFQLGEHTKALELLYEALQLSEKNENLWGQAYNRMLISFVYFDRGEIGQAIQLSTQAISEGDRGGLVASSTSHRAELGWFFGYYGDIEKGLELAEQALKITEAKQPDFRALPLAVKVRLYLLEGDVESAKQAAGPAALEPITIPYSRYTIIVCLANVELALAKKEYESALILAENLLEQVSPLTRVDIPAVMQRKADALIGLGKFDEAHQVLTQACSLAEDMGSKHHLWSVLSSLVDVSTKLDKQNEADVCRKKARQIVEAISNGLQEIGLRESFLSQQKVRALIRS